MYRYKGVGCDTVEEVVALVNGWPDDWVEWNGGECPVPDGTETVVRFKDGDEDIATADIVAYKVVK